MWLPADLAAERDWAVDWLFSDALPLWWEKGADHTSGGWHDKLGGDASPLDLPKRLRVQARQTFVYAEAGRMGWDGPWREAVEHGLAFIFAKFRRADGLFRSSVTAAGEPLVENADLYDQAFVLLAMASGFAMLERPPALQGEAQALLRNLVSLLAHPVVGFEEAKPRVLPLRSNPHMHLLEAMLAWIMVGGGYLFEHHARSILDLACCHLIDPATGAIGEYYDAGWGFDGVVGHLREPGHQFEWAYLLAWADQVLGTNHKRRSEKLRSFAIRYGIVEGRTIFAISADGSPIDSSSRLWAQTERLRTMLIAARSLPASERAAAFADAAEALATLKRFLDVPLRGSWVDRVDPYGNWLDEPAPASSLYHIVTGLVPLIEAPALLPVRVGVRASAQLD